MALTASANVATMLFPSTGLAVLLLLGRFIYFSVIHPLAIFPGPLPAKWGDIYCYCLLLSGRGPWRTHDLHKKYGPIVRIAPNHLSFNDHSAQKIIYGFGTENDPSMRKEPRFFTPEVDHSMNIINGCDKEEHSRMRRMLSFAFNVVDSFRSGHSKMGMDVVRIFNYVTFDIMGEMPFEPRYHWADVTVNTTYMNDVMRAVLCVPGLFSFLEWLPPAHSKRTFYRHVEHAIEHTEARLKLQTHRKDFMYHILDNKGPAATPKEIASHFNVIMVAGTVTTATFLSGVLYYLGHNCQALKRLQDEMRSTFSSVEAITSKALLACVYLNAVVEEGLTIYPPAGAAHLSRIAPQGGCVISGRFIPQSTRVSVHPWSILRDPSNFHAPSHFIPERRIEALHEGKKGDKLDRSLPSSHGPRDCLGRNLAYLEMRMVFAKLFWKYDLIWFNAEGVDWERDYEGIHAVGEARVKM